jgi:hypothetical protein
VEHVATLRQLADHHPRRHGLHADQARLPAVVSAVSMEMREYDSTGQPKHGKAVRDIIHTPISISCLWIWSSARHTDGSFSTSIAVNVLRLLAHHWPVSVRHGGNGRFLSSAFDQALAIHILPKVPLHLLSLSRVSSRS